MVGAPTVELSAPDYTQMEMKWRPETAWSAADMTRFCKLLSGASTAESESSPPDGLVAERSRRSLGEGFADGVVERATVEYNPFGEIRRRKD